MKTKTKIPATWVVVVRCTLDDVIAGSYPRIAMARQRMADILAGKAEKSATSASDRMRPCWDDSSLIAVAIYRTQGERIEHWEQRGFGEEKDAA